MSEQMEQKTDTPETDAVCDWVKIVNEQNAWTGKFSEMVSGEFARNLEHQRNALYEALKHAQELLRDSEGGESAVVADALALIESTKGG